MNSWILGYIIGAVVVAVVVVVLALMIVGARRTADKAEAIAADLRVARDRTGPLRDLADTSGAVRRIGAAATAARLTLQERGGR